MQEFDKVINDTVVIVTKATNNVIRLPMVIDPVLLTCEIEDYKSMLPSIEKANEHKQYVVIISPRIKEILTNFEYKVFLYVESLVAIEYKKRALTPTTNGYALTLTAGAYLSDKKIHYNIISDLVVLGYGRFYLNALIKIRDVGCKELSLKEKEVCCLTVLIQSLTSVCRRFKTAPSVLKAV